MKKSMILGLAALMGVLTSCGQKAGAEAELHVIFDNPAPRTMPLSLFGEVPAELAKAKGWTMYGMHFPTTEGMAVK